MNKLKSIVFPEFTGVRCNMMPIIQGDGSSLPSEYRSYAKLVDENYIEKGKIGFLTIDERFVEKHKSQRGYNSKGINRNVHIEVGVVGNKNRWGGGTDHPWGGKETTLLDDDTEVLIANSISDTCRVWDVEERSYTKDGDLSAYIDKYPEDTGILMKAGDLYKIGIFTPHECVAQTESKHRQFFRLVGEGVHGREPYFTVNPLVSIHA